MKLSKNALKVALKALKDLGATAEEIVTARKAGTLDSVYDAAERLKLPRNNEAYKKSAIFRIKGMRNEPPSVGELVPSARSLMELPGPPTEGQDYIRRLLDIDESRRRDVYANNLATMRLSNERPRALNLLSTVALNTDPGQFNLTQFTPKDLLTANQIARRGGDRVVEELAEAGLPDPLRTARALLREVFSDQQKEIFLSLVQNGYSPEDAAQLAKALS